MRGSAMIFRIKGEFTTFSPDTFYGGWRKCGAFEYLYRLSVRLYPFGRQNGKGRVRLVHTRLPRRGEPCATCQMGLYSFCDTLSWPSANGSGNGPKSCSSVPFWHQANGL